MGLSWLGVERIFTPPFASPASHTHPAAELGCAGGVEFFLEGFEVAEGFLDYFGDGAGGIASAVRLHDVPEHGVVDVATAIVADGVADIFGDGIQVAGDLRRFSCAVRDACPGPRSGS